MESFEIGIMQGRLSQKSNSPLQSFPINSWEFEFNRANKIGFKKIEWLIDKENDYNNPFFSKKDRQKIAYLSQQYKVSIQTLCLHFLINGSILNDDPRGISTKEYLLEICKLAPEIGIKYLSIPLLEKMSLKKMNVRKKIESILNEIFNQTNVEILLETDISTSNELAFMKKLNTKKLGILYDTGNATQKNSVFENDFPLISEFVKEIHIKDFSKRKNRSVRLGEGDTKFRDIFKIIKNLKWSGPIILETPILENWNKEAEYNFQYISNLFEQYF